MIARRIILAAAVLFVALLSACSRAPKTPSEVAVAYAKALMSGDYARAMSFSDQALGAQIETLAAARSTMEPGALALVEADERKLAGTNVTVVSETVGESDATILLRAEGLPDRELPLVLRNGTWLVTTIAPPPAEALSGDFLPEFVYFGELPEIRARTTDGAAVLLELALGFAEDDLEEPALATSCVEEIRSTIEAIITSKSAAELSPLGEDALRAAIAGALDPMLGTGKVKSIVFERLEVTGP